MSIDPKSSNNAATVPPQAPTGASERELIETAAAVAPQGNSTTTQRAMNVVAAADIQREAITRDFNQKKAQVALAVEQQKAIALQQAASAKHSYTAQGKSPISADAQQASDNLNRMAQAASTPPQPQASHHLSSPATGQATVDPQNQQAHPLHEVAPGPGGNTMPTPHDGEQTSVLPATEAPETERTTEGNTLQTPPSQMETEDQPPEVHDLAPVPGGNTMPTPHAPIETAGHAAPTSAGAQYQNPQYTVPEQTPGTILPKTVSGQETPQPEHPTAPPHPAPAPEVAAQPAPPPQPAAAPSIPPTQPTLPHTAAPGAEAPFAQEVALTIRSIIEQEVDRQLKVLLAAYTSGSEGPGQQ